MSARTCLRLSLLPARTRLILSPTSSTRAFTVATYHLRHSSALRRQLPSPSAIRYASTMVKVPQMAESISEGTLKQWQKKVGDYVEQDEEIATIETDKIDVAVNAPEAGVIKEFLVNEEDTVTVGQDIVRLEAGGAPAAKESGGKEEEEASGSSSSSKSEPPKQQAQQQQPTTPEPKPAEASESSGSGSPGSGAVKPGAANPDSPIGTRGEHRVKMSRTRLRTAERLKQSQNTAASLTTFQEVDMTDLVAFRGKNKDDVLKRTGVKLGFMGAFARACVLAMRDFPVVNAAIEETGENVVFRDYVDISVAVSTDKGLVTPVVRNVEAMDIITIERSIAELGQKARDRKLTIEDMTGGTFTISNGGVFGSLMGTPIINTPQSAVLGLHAIKDRPAVVNGAVEVRKMMYLALTYDHRLLDGREAVLFLVRVKDLIEDPRRMLL